MSGEYVRSPKGPDRVHTKSAQGNFSVFKRGMEGVCKHCAREHPHRYLAEFDFRHNHRVVLGVDDGTRVLAAVRALLASF